MEKSYNTGKVVGVLLIGAVIGGTVGAVLGILFAPERGRVMRKKLLANGGDFADSPKGKFNEFVEEVKGEAGTVKERVNQFVENGDTRVDTLK